MLTSLAPLLALNNATYHNTILNPRTKILRVAYSEGALYNTIDVNLDSKLVNHLMTLLKYKSSGGYEILSYQIQELIEQERVERFKRKLNLLVSE